ncbi:MAG: TetR/AcrR family transcriptional regulator [Candidatus Aminicenantes bacterium]|nr:MAG: TetR/AcrR family transcriptional regulator [Candidatus Aminicenantes bacterium]
MRFKDEAKQDAIIKATVKLVNQIGFASSSVSKIAKQANVSPATIYIYYQNKEDLLVSTYVDIKQKLSEAILKDFDDTQPIKDILRGFWFNAFDFISSYSDNFQYTEQFANSPYSSLVDKKEVEKYFEPMIEIIQRGKEQKILKDVPFDILQIFIFYPIMILANPRLCANFDCTEKNIEIAFNMAWDAIRA